MQRDRFGDNDKLADELGALVVQGVKTASCYAYGSDTAFVPVGKQVLIENSKGQDWFIIEITQVDLVPFHKVSAAFAYLEGEGDRSLENWRHGHQRYFARNGGFSPDMMLVCEQFKVVKVF